MEAPSTLVNPPDAIRPSRVPRRLRLALGGRPCYQCRLSFMRRIREMPMKIAVLPGDGTGPEVVREALKVLAAVSKLEGFSYTTQEFNYGGDRFLATGEIISEE